MPRFLLLALPRAAFSAASCSDDGNLELTFLANEGFLLRSDDTAVLIDAFVVESHASTL
ncbi:MAG: hypothetical protein H0W33_05455 [Gammaproteobacteria bacterium]|nr:hypothetical protein [Gammaproteobacteria bacterium]